MTDQLEHDLRVLFADRAERADVPPVPADLFAVEVPTPWRRRAVVAGLVAAAVAAIAVPVGLAARDRDDVAPPTKAPDEPHSLEVPYLLDGELHRGDLTVPTSATGLTTAGTQVLAFVGDDGAGGTAWQRLVGDRLEAMPYLDDLYGVTVSYDGTLVAGPGGAGPDAVRVWDTATGNQVDSIFLDTPPSPSEPWLWGFDDQGRLFWSDGADLRMRAADGAVVTVRTGGRGFLGLTPGGILLRNAGIDERTAPIASVADDGSVLPYGEVPVSTTVAWNGRDRMLFQALASGLVATYDVTTGTQVPITVDGSSSPTPVGWIGDEVVVVAQETGPQDSGPQRVVAVDPATGEQRLLFEFDTDDPAVFPTLSGTGAL